MDYHSHHMRRRFMDDSVYRSAPASPLTYTSDHIDARTPRYSPRVFCNDSPRTGSLDGALECDRARIASLDLDRGVYGFGTDSRWRGDVLMRRTNRDIAMLNAAITRPTNNAQMNPLVAFDGRYPQQFSSPERLNDLLRMRDAELDEVMLAHELGHNRDRSYRGPLMNRLEHRDPYSRSRSERIRNFLTLSEYLGAPQVAEHLRLSR
ncbi:hypothetical protein Tdes44962_MAKER04100 [Teratosphaeria destructans]|uniref:Uncharacterized protein n=1 Tax=Teratosphaeria destructans TaxID=418781 RepID=A0A9W7W091_9PEZI|nr:hypothetical protein Tdes44962_MAKER04100 [Teratosphaeria destructans]